MPDLIAQGMLPEQRWRRRLPVDRTCLLGRDCGFWSVPWDSRISRQHAELRWEHGQLQVRRLDSARNPIFVRGSRQDSFALESGQHFVIGDTTFTLADERIHVSLHLPQPFSERTFPAEELQSSRFRNAEQRIDLLSRIPPIIAGAAGDEELFVRLVSVLFSGIPHGDAVALVAVESAGGSSPVRVLHWDRRALSDRSFQPSERLIRRAVESGQSVVHVWNEGPPESAGGQQSLEGDWAFCVPVPGAGCRGWALYVSGRFASLSERGDLDLPGLRDDLKFAEVLASHVSSLRQARLLERNQASLRQFFSPRVLDALADRDPEDVLTPRQTEVSVLFCDLRGFSRQAEHLSDDLPGLLRRVSDALGVTTRRILDQGGVVGDFHGDAVMGFWGWPFPQPDAVQRACRAALRIRDEFLEASEQPQHPLADFRLGIGLASGPAVAGKIGTVDQVKVTVFGPVVNRAARLEGLTKTLRASILLDEATAAAARRTLAPGEARIRRVAVVRPYGLDSALEVSELRPPALQDPQLSDDALAAYEAALDAMCRRCWPEAFQLLHRVPAEDQVKDFLTVFMAQHNRTPPADWDGVIPIPTK
jgi:adenylate cyclase